MKKTFYILLFTLLLTLSLSHESFAVVVETSTDLSPIISSCGESSCNVGTGFSVVKEVMGGIIKYFTYIAGLGGVLFIVINGVMYSMSGVFEGGKAQAKERITKTLLGLILLMLSGVILYAIAPWIYQ